MNILYALIFISLTEAFKNDWVDPHDMNTNAKSKFKIGERGKQSTVSRAETTRNVQPSIEDTMSLIYLKRTVSLLLNSANSDKDNPNVIIGSYQYVQDSEEHKFLVDFTRNKEISIEDVRRLDTVLSTLFSKSYKDSIFNFNAGILKEEILDKILHPNFLIMLGVTFFVFIMYILLRDNFGFVYIISYFFLIILIVDYGFRYRVLYEAAEEHNLKLSYTSECDTAKMDWFAYFKFTMSQKDCERRIVSPLDVALNQLKHIIIIPTESVGTGMGKFGRELWDNLPFPWNILIFPIMLVFILALSFLFVLAYKNTTFKLKLFHLFHLEFGKSEEEGNRITGGTLDKLLDATTHRRMVEDARSSPDRNQKRNKKKNTPPKKETQKQPQGITPRNKDEKDKVQEVVQIISPKNKDKNVEKREAIKDKKEILEVVTKTS